jgi:hypothetical protein
MEKNVLVQMKSTDALHILTGTAIYVNVSYFYVYNMFVCLFSWHYNPLWLYFHSPVADFSLLVFEVS